MGTLKKVLRWLDDRTGLGRFIDPLAFHLVPPESTWMYVFGTTVLFAFIVQVVTGVALLTSYVPSAGGAYESLKFITEEAPFGRLLRGMHFWGASVMIAAMGLHLLRVFLTGSYKYPREANWLTGVALLGLTLGMGFTGQLLRWDQNAVWSVVVGAEQAGRTPFIGKWAGDFILGGETLGAQTLSRIFAVHVMAFPALIAAVVSLHLYLVLRNGISEPPVLGVAIDPGTYRASYKAMLDGTGVPFWPNAAWRDTVFAVSALALVLVLAGTFGPAALDNPADPTMIQAHPRPDWYFWWYFALLAYLPHGLEDYVILLAPLLGFGALLALPFVAGRGERHPLRRPWAVAAVVVALGVIGALTVAGRRENWSPRFDAKPLPATEVGAASGPIHDGAAILSDKGCLFCHSIAGHGGRRGPDLTDVANRLTADQMTVRILNGGYNMPAFASILSAAEMRDLIAFLSTRRGPGPGLTESTEE
jgi:ubiquinol-cytochrome c reductase cytochrome b subunit